MSTAMDSTGREGSVGTVDTQNPQSPGHPRTKQRERGASELWPGRVGGFA